MISNGYGIMPNKVLFSKELSDKQKLLYVLISSLCAEKGHCRASNKYLGDKIGCSETWISKQISDLVKKGYIKSSVDAKNGNSRAIELQDKTSGTTEQDPSGTTVQHNSITSLIFLREKNSSQTEKKLTTGMLECCEKMFDLGWELKETIPKLYDRFYDTIKKNYGINQMSGHPNSQPFYSIVRARHTYHTEKGDKIERHKSSILQFVSRDKNNINIKK